VTYAPEGDSLTSVDAHLERVLATVRPLGALEVGLAEAHGSLLAEDVHTPIALPPFDNSSMDGYAVRLDDVSGARPDRPVVLPVIADIAAGSTAAVTLQPGLAVRIMTGAPVPPGTEAIVPVEWTDGGVRQVAIRQVPLRGAFIRRIGEDLPQGALVLADGAYLGSAQIGLLAATGRHGVRIHPKPRVVVLSTGSELADPGTELGPAQVYDANSHALAAACREAGAVPYRIGVVPDDPARLTEVLEDYLIQADVMITSGGVSVGAYDVVKQVLQKVGSVRFDRVAMQPGMPQGFGTLGPDEIPLFALPGNPVSALVSFEVFVRPALRRLVGAAELHRPRIAAAITSDWQSPAGKRQYVRVRVTPDGNGGFSAAPVGGPGSHLIASMAAANGLLIVPQEAGEVAAGTVCSVMLLDRRGA
jgi:molybdopterin molybdotransferase